MGAARYAERRDRSEIHGRQHAERLGEREKGGRAGRLGLGGWGEREKGQTGREVVSQQARRRMGRREDRRERRNRTRARET
eukprot:6190128-Pleurochrysis_carterae.AAC.1